MTLKLGDRFTMPDEAVTQTFALFGKRGSGKTNGATVLAEEMYANRLPFVVLDPVDAWWGLKSSFDGKEKGLNVYVFGGPHADLPLEPTGGALMADVIIEHQIPTVLCFKGWTGADRTRFASAFAERLLMKNAEPLHVFLEEADAFIPQRPQRGEETMLGHFDRMVRWGRQSGIGCTLITQRSAKVNKDVTTQAETLISFRVIGPQDRDAIDNWIKFHAGEAKRQEVLASIAVLEDGEAWVWSPEWLDLLDRKMFRRRRTYDSAATPKPGEKRPAPKELAKPDLERLGKQMAATREKAEASDPRRLQARIRELEKQLSERLKVEPIAKVQKVQKVVERVEVPVWLHPQMPNYLNEIAGDLTEAAARLKGLARTRPERPRGATTVAPAAPISRPPTPQTPPPKSPPRGTTDLSARLKPANGQLGGGEQRILNALLWLEEAGKRAPNRVQIALLAGYKPDTGTVNTYFSRLRSAGLVESTTRGTESLTAAGRQQTVALERTLTPQMLQDRVREVLDGPQNKILSVLLEAYPDDLDKAEVATAAGYAPDTGTVNTYFSRMNASGVIEYPARGRVRAAPLLFLED